MPTPTYRFPHRVYYVSSDQDDTVLLALGVYFAPDMSIQWFDTLKPRIFYVEKVLDDNPEHFVFERARRESPEPRVYNLTPLTLDIYQEKVRPHLLAPGNYTNEEEMFKAIETTLENDI